MPRWDRALAPEGQPRSEPGTAEQTMQHRTMRSTVSARVWAEAELQQRRIS